VTVGDDSVVQGHVTISNYCRVGKNVFIGPNTSLLNDKYPMSKAPTPAVIEDEVIIGGCVTILPCVTVGKRAVVGAGSIVAKDVASKTVVRGVPAYATGDTRTEYDRKRMSFLTFYEG